ncbi:MAG: DNA methyltransferase, partial [Xanthobacteraceae bacterium]|nr:DNA methyltransferase [Xanthobacteraceae bacterium]
MAQKQLFQASSDDTAPEINYPLVEETRPSIYRAMKYWGKKPHNIWAQYIKRYCPPGGLVVDPFAGSAVAAFEAVKLGRRAVAFDLNPLSSFIIEVTASQFDKGAFLAAAKQVRESAEASDVYRTHYTRTRDGEIATVLNYRWERDELVSVAIETADHGRKLIDAEAADQRLAEDMRSLEIPAWYPTRKLPRHPSVTHRFIRDAGGETIDHLWTRRNLYLLASMFESISATANNDLRLQLLSAFIQSLHLCTKMVIPRNKAANRDFSGSWGRPDFLIRRRRMEQNPV